MAIKVSDRPPPLASLKHGQIPNWVLKTEHSLNGDSLSYLDMMERNNVEENRRARERIIMDEGRAMWDQKRKEDDDLMHRETEEVREMSRNKMFGRPGHGAPTIDVRKKRFTEHQLDKLKHQAQGQGGFSWEGEEFGQVMHPEPVRKNEDLYDTSDALSFGRPGCGAPVRTKSGRIRTAITGNPEIRFQANESVQKTISNNIRYSADKDDKAIYHKELEEQIRERKEMEAMEKHNNREVCKQLEEVEGLQWGRPGPGGAYWRNSAITGQGFFDKMGWCGSADPRKRQYETKHSEADEIRKEIEDIKVKKEIEHQDINSGIGCELVPLMKDKQTGKPHKDPATGYMMSHGLSSTDVTKLADKKGSQFLSTRSGHDDKRRYWDTLNSQVSEKLDYSHRHKEFDEEQQKRHFESWETFWGRPGYGAPREVVQKGNLMKMLHYPEKAPGSVELISLERLPVK